MVDNFNLRAFLSENKLTKNSQLLKEGDDYKYFDEEGTGGFYMTTIDGVKIYSLEDSSIMDTCFYALEGPQGVEVIGIDVSGEPVDADYVEQDSDVTGKIAEFIANDINSQLEEEGLLEASRSMKNKMNEARVEGFDENQKAFEVSFINKYGGGDFRILNAETPEQAEEVFTDIFANNLDFVQSIKSIKPYQVPAAKPQVQSQPGLEGVDYGSIEIDGIDPDDYPDFVDAYVISAQFEDGTPLSEEELEQLTDELYQSGQLADMAAQSLYENKKKPMMKETNLTAKERRLVEMVQRAMGIQEEEIPNPHPQNPDHEFGTDALTGKPLPDPASQMVVEDEMADETVIPEYRTIDELMKSIDHGTNEVAEKHKMEQMKKIAEALRMKAKKMEESEHAAHISPKDLRQLATDAAKLEKAAEKLKSAFDKKFNKKEKPSAAPKEQKVEALQEGFFDLRKFLAENRK
jgi:hypothetical protein